MTLSEWVERLRLMSVSTIVHIEPSECADLVRAIEGVMVAGQKPGVLISSDLEP